MTNAIDSRESRFLAVRTAVRRGYDIVLVVGKTVKDAVASHALLMCWIILGVAALATFGGYVFTSWITGAA
jgi:hypothetical protein